MLSLPIVALSCPARPSALDRLGETLAGLVRQGLRPVCVWLGAKGFAPLVDEALGHWRDQGVDTLLAGAADGHAARLLLRHLAYRYDVVLAGGTGLPPLPARWPLGDDEADPGGTVRLLRSAEDLGCFLERQWLLPPLVGCLLIGGKSSRMGRAKHLIELDGQTWLARTAALLSQVCDRVVLAGQGELSGSSLPRLADIPETAGPLAGLLAAMRWQPWSTVLACACDMPDLSRAALDWLLAQRRPGAWAVIPTVGGRHQPLLGLYDFRSRPALEDMAGQDNRRLGALLGCSGVQTPTPPEHLARAWRNVNTPGDLSIAGRLA